MRTWLFPLAAIALLVVLLAGVRQERASACSCAPLSPSDLFAEADAVFAGEVVAGGGGLVEFKVSRVWKGDLDSTASMVLTGQGTSCAFSPDQGKEYLVYAFGDYAGEPFRIGLCTTKPLGAAQEDLDALGPGEPPPAGAASLGPRASATPQPPEVRTENLPEPKVEAAGTESLPESKAAAAGSRAIVLSAAAILLIAGVGFVAARRRARRG